MKRIVTGTFYAILAGAAGGCGAMQDNSAKPAASVLFKFRGPGPFVGCLGGPGVAVKRSCDPDDADRDGDVDLRDWAYGTTE